MRTKFLTLLLTLVAFLVMSASAARITDDDLDFQGSNDADVIYPVNIEIPVVEGTISYENKTITVAFLEDLGNVTIQILDESKTLYISEKAAAVKAGTVKIDISSLPAGSYKIYCFIENEKPQVANFQLSE